MGSTRQHLPKQWLNLHEPFSIRATGAYAPMKWLMGIVGSPWIPKWIRLRIAVIDNAKPDGEEMRCWRLKQFAPVEHLIAPASLDDL